MKIKMLIQVIGVLSVSLAVAGCASIMHGTSQEVGISSSPSGATVSVNEQHFGTTPAIADLKRGDNHTVRIELVGYHPYETTLTKKVSGWVWGNIVFGGLIGLAVDAISGGLYNLTPEQIQATLASQERTELEHSEDSLLIFVTLSPDPSWTKVDQMVRAE